MAKIEAYVAIEETVREVVFKAIQKPVEEVTKFVQQALTDNDYQTAERLINEFSLTGLLEKRRKYLREVLLTAMLFGQSQIVPAKLTALTTGAMDIPEELDDGIDQMILLIERQMVENVQMSLRNEMAKAMAEDELTPFTKAEKTIRVNAPEEVANYAKAGVGTRANLVTSRLVSFGFLSQAIRAGVDKYQISEKLDDRTCPVCKYMHGHVFSVENELERLTLALKTKDPEELKSLAPWPSQTKAGLKDLYSMSPSDLKSRGYSVPPFHPMCRGVLVKVGTTERVFFPSAQEMETGVPEVDMDWLDEAGGSVAATEAFKKVLKGNDQAKIISRMFGGDTFNSFGMDLYDEDGIKSLIISARNGEKIERLTRTFEIKDEGLVVKHDMFRLWEDKQGGSIAKTVLKDSFKLYDELGVSRVELEANIDVGSYAWAKYGFLPTDKAWAQLRVKLSERIESLSVPRDVEDMLLALIESDDPRTIWLIADSPYGKDLLLSASWDGYIDLKNAQAMDRFKGYISK